MAIIARKKYEMPHGKWIGAISFLEAKGRACRLQKARRELTHTLSDGASTLLALTGGYWDYADDDWENGDDSDEESN